MAFLRPTLAEITDRVQQDLQSRLALVAPILRRAMVYIFARVIAGAVHMLYGHMEYLARQVFPDLSEGEYLLRQAALFGINRTAAAFAAGNVTITGTDATVIPIGTVLQRADGAQYETDAEVTIAGGTATAAVTALLAGADGNCVATVTLTLESPIAGADSTVTVATGGLAGGADEETLDALRVRLIERLRDPPHGGASADYVAWAKEIAGVTRAWCYPLEGGAGTVTVRFVRDNDVSIIPDAGEVAAVQAHIDTVRPVTAAVTVAAPTATPIAYTIHIHPDTSEVRAAVIAELTDMLRRDASPGSTTLLSQIRVAVGTAEGVTDFSVTVPAADVTRTVSQLSTQGTVTWV